MIALEQQRLPSSKKTKEWADKHINAICSRIDEFSTDWFRMWQNYRLNNNQVEQEEFREYCDTLGLKKGEGHKFVEPFNKTHTIISVLAGEEASMPWSYGVINLSPHATNEVLREKQRLIRNYVDERLELEIDKQNALTDLKVKAATEGMPPEQLQQASQELKSKFEEQAKKIFDPSQIQKKFSNYKSIKERTMYKLLQAVAVNQHLKWVKNQTFHDALIAGIEIVEIEVDEYTGIPQVKQINPLDAFYHKSNNSPFIHTGDYAGYKEKLIISDALDEFNDYLDDKQLARLRDNHGKVFGYHSKFHSPDGESFSHWDHLKKYEYTNQNLLSTIPNYGSTNVLSDGLYANNQDRLREEHFCVVYTIYWKSYRRIGKLNTTDELGEPVTTFVGEEFVIPKEAVKVKVPSKKLFAKPTIKYEWYTLEGQYFSVEWLWIPEIWKAKTINGNMVVYAEPYENAYQSLLNPYKTKLPLMGFIYNNRNAFTVSIMDRIKPWQKLYYVIMSKWLKLITQDKGVVNLINVLMMDKDIGYEESLALAVDQGILPYNPLAHTKGTAVASNHQPASKLDLSNAQQLAQYTQLLQFVEQQLKLSAGISEQRLAQTGSSTNVTDNQRDMAQSLNITNGVFNAHDLLWKEVLQSVCETLAKTMDSKNEFIRQILSDDEIALLDLGLISMEDEYAVRIGDNSRSHRILQESRQLAHALVQNDKASFSTLLDLMTTDNLSEFKEQLKGIEADIETREAQMQQQQQQMQKEEQEFKAKESEAEHKRELEKIELKGEYDIKKSQIQGLSWHPDKDVDKDGMPDILEIEKFRNQVMNDKVKQNLEKDKVRQEDMRLEQKKQELAMKREQSTSDRYSKERIKRQEIASKEKMNKEKKSEK